MIILLFVLFSMPITVFSATCGSSGIPFRFELLPSGDVVLGCAAPLCFGAENGGRDMMRDQHFEAGPNGEDGFFREGDMSRSRARHPDSPSQQARCPAHIDASACTNPMTWVGGLMQDEGGELKLQCCHYEGLRFAAEVGRPVVHRGEVYSGGEVLRDGRQTGFDLISNVRQISDGPDGPAYELTVTRMNCLPDPPEIENDVMIDPRSDINRILDKVPDSNSISNLQVKQHGVQTNSVIDGLEPPYQAPLPAPGGDSYAVPQPPPPAPVPEQPVQTQEQFVQVGEQVIPVTQQGYYYPVASGYACFTGDDTVQTQDGIKKMEDLKIGDSVLTIDGHNTYYTEVEYFMHRKEDQSAEFLKIYTDSGKTITLTGKHFIYRVDCDTGIYDLVYAEHILPTDCLFEVTKDQLNYEKRKVRVNKVIRERRTGIFAPMTETGDLLVNEIYVSCHNIIKENTITQTFMNIFAELHKILRSYYLHLPPTGDLPISSEFFHSIIGYIIPTKF